MKGSTVAQWGKFLRGKSKERPVAVNCGKCGTAFVQARPFPDWDGENRWFPACACRPARPKPVYPK